MPAHSHMHKLLHKQHDAALSGAPRALRTYSAVKFGAANKMPSTTKGLQRRLNASSPRSTVKSCFFAPRVANLAKKQKPTKGHCT